MERFAGRTREKSLDLSKEGKVDLLGGELGFLIS